MTDHIMITCTYDLGDALIKVIGEVVVSFGQLEHTVAVSIKRTNPRMTLADVQALTNGIFERSDDARESFERWAMNQELEGNFRRHIDEIRDIARCRRNDVIHGLWGKDPEGRVRWLRNWEDSGEIKMEQLESLRDQIQILIRKINGATSTLTCEVSALPC
jgi:hypothetical protein